MSEPTTDREGLAAEIADVLWKWSPYADGEKVDALADALADLLAARERQTRAEALRDFGFWLEKNIGSPAAHKAAYDRADRIEATP